MTATPGNGDARLANLVAALAVALADRIREATETAAGHAAAGPAALAALDEFLDHPNLDRVRDVIGLTSSGTVRLVDRLAAHGYVERRPGRDGRSVAVVLTAAGHEAAARIRAARAAAVDGALADLSPAERASLTRVVEKVLGTVTSERLRARERGDVPPGGWLCRLCDFEACGRPRGACPVAETARARAG